ncbi:MAG: hypothetical protein ACOH2V_00380 [Candidatus Saccharimonadaceae bacterium]
MLPTNQKAEIYKFRNTNKLIISHHPEEAILQHLYIISNEEIKKDDWFIHPDSDLSTTSTGGYEILQCTKRDANFIWYEKLTVPGVSTIAQPFRVHVNFKPKKIIATTDTSLRVISLTHFGALLQPSSSFIEAYIKAYNEGNPITEVMVEYEGYICKNGHYMDYQTTCAYPHCNEYNHLQLKVNSKDNTITIHRIKDSWTTEGVYSIMQQYMEYCTWRGYITPMDWVKNNL